MLHASLRETLGKHVTQKGSLVSFDRLRFDFSHPKPVSKDELKKIENKVNKIIKQSSRTNISLMSYKDAVKKGAMALFGEKYDEEVMFVIMFRI